MMVYLVELGPYRRPDPAASAVAAMVARTFGPRRRAARLATPSSLEALAARRLGLVRFSRPK
ncbi:MAG: hypothetical protein KF878_08440 [Planctomycetes bacterium]|nr:hypothetical protein [Planctomycetota bacterium]